MTNGDVPSIRFTPEFTSALGNLQRLLSGVLWDAKSNSCFGAWTQIQKVRSGPKKKAILDEKARQWRENSAKAIRDWLPKFVELAYAYPEAIDDDPLRWTKEKVWERVEMQCGIQSPKGNTLPIHDRINRVTVYWFAVASEGNMEVNIPPLRPWTAPRWLARHNLEADELLREHTGNLWLRLNHVIDEELSIAQIQTAIRSRQESMRDQPKQNQSELGENEQPRSSVKLPDKLADPARFPTMTTKEVMALINVSRASVYRYLSEGRLERPGLNKKPGKRSKTLILTSSVKQMLQTVDE